MARSNMARLAAKARKLEAKVTREKKKKELQDRIKKAQTYLSKK
jgi:hypothetical protein